MQQHEPASLQFAFDQVTGKHRHAGPSDQARADGDEVRDDGGNGQRIGSPIEHCPPIPAHDRQMLGVGDERDALDLGERIRFALQPPGGCCHKKEFLVEERHSPQALGARLNRADDDIEFAARQRVEEIIGKPEPQAQAGLDLIQQLRQARNDDRAQELGRTADSECAVLGSQGGEEQLIERIHVGPGCASQLVSRRSRNEPRWSSLEERLPEHLLDVAQVRGHGRLRHAEPPCGP